MDDESMFAAFEEAVALAGTQTAFARAVGCTQGNIWQLLERRSPLPGKYVLKAEACFAISRHRLRPDLYPVADLACAPGKDACDRSAVLHGRAPHVG